MMRQRVLLCTGGIGSGKSVVVRALRALGFPSYDCDAAAKELYDRDRGLLAEVVALAGPGVLDEGGRLDRTALAARVFAEPGLLRQIEALVHPAVLRDFAAWRATQDAPWVVLESAILLEKPVPPGTYDRVLVVTAPESVRMARVIARDGVTEAQVRARMEAQWSDAQRVAKADDVLENDGRQALLPVLLPLIEKLKEDGKN